MSLAFDLTVVMISGKPLLVSTCAPTVSVLPVRKPPVRAHVAIAGVATFLSVLKSNSSFAVCQPRTRRSAVVGVLSLAVTGVAEVAP